MIAHPADVEADDQPEQGTTGEQDDNSDSECDTDYAKFIESKGRRLKKKKCDSTSHKKPSCVVCGWCKTCHKKKGIPHDFLSFAMHKETKRVKTAMALQYSQATNRRLLRKMDWINEQRAVEEENWLSVFH